MNKIVSVVLMGLLSVGISAQAQDDTSRGPTLEKAAAKAAQSVEREIPDEEDAPEETFNPSEKINVDSSVSFPVDI